MRGLPRAERPRLKKLVRLGTLNVGTLTGRSREVADLLKRRRIQVLCLQETRWKGAKAREIGEGVKLYYNIETPRGTGINDRIMSLRLDTKEGYWTIMSVYAPQTGCSEHDKDNFYLSLEEAIRSVPEGDYLSITGDMNGYVGNGRRGVERAHGGKGIGLINPDGERILDLAIAHDLAVCSTFFTKRESQKVTYASGERRTEVDHILVRRAALKTVRHVKVNPGEDVASQHRPLVADLSIPLSTHQAQKRNELRRAVLEAGLPDPAGPVNETWRRVAQTILRCAKETLGEAKGGTRGDKSAWFWNEEKQAAVRRKKEAYKLWQKTRAPEHLAAYRKLKRLAKTTVAKAKNAEMDALYEKLDGPEGEKFAIRLAKARHRASLDIRVVKIVKSADGRMLPKPVEVRERWEEYFKELLNEEFSGRLEKLMGVRWRVLTLSAEEVRVFSWLPTLAISSRSPSQSQFPLPLWRCMSLIPVKRQIR
ncbi:unnamed protein product [Heligmosomoides polygyrus]|uniref:Endo/exonuclease/phosphatase domain-containing protein n=1 Tax=Heligmosomoides polygyrus TaxID=6339 RepID=A0A183GTV6_HELPZ|nr:unnamed protein product [Heligmosomoides polygyrus]